jgi:hypothetical protein
VLALALASQIASCGGGSDVAAFECAEKAKVCAVDGRSTCVASDDPRYGCGSPVTCLACGSLGFAHVKTAGCDVVRGTCLVLACEDNYKHCPSNGPESGGCETAINSDPRNCGGCDLACPTNVPNGSPVCILQQCMAACDAGFFDCDKQVATGCECTKGCNGTACLP